MRGEGLFPLELTTDVPKISMTGKQLIHVEQHKGLMTYQEDEVAFRTSVGMLKIQGKDMHFKQYTATEAIISGEIGSVTLLGGGSK